MPNKRILITGANGFIGSYLIEEALLQNFDAFAGIRKASNTKYLDDNRISFFELNYENRELLQEKFANAPRFDIIIHNAGLTKAQHPNDYFTVNYEYTKNIIDALIQTNKVPDKFIYMSSLAAFGPADNHPHQEVRIGDIPMPVTTYGKSKLASEQYLQSLKNFPYLIIRPTAVYGPRDKDLLTFFKIINKHIEPYIGLPDQHFTFIFIKDLVKAVMLAAKSDLINASFFVSDGHIYSRRAVGDNIKAALNKKTLRFALPLPMVRLAAGINQAANFLRGRQSIFNLEKVNELGSVNWRCDNNPLQKATGFKAQYDLANGIRETAAWYKTEKWL